MLLGFSVDSVSLPAHVWGDGISGAFPIALAVAFDTLKLARKLEAAGFEHKQAADVSEAMAEAFTITEIATKADIDRLAAANKADIDRLAVDIERLAETTKADIGRLAVDIDRLAETTKAALRESEHRQAAENAATRAEMKAMELRMTIKLGVMLAALFTMTVGAVAAIVRLMLH